MAYPTDLSRYLRASRKLDLEGIDFERVRDYPLSKDLVRCLTYMMDIETHTVIYLRDLLATSAARDPDVTAFLSLWVYEEFWHGEALGRFLEAAGERFTPDRTTQIRTYANARSAVSKALKTAAGKVLPDFVAVHMTWGAINELSTLEGYHRVIAKSGHPILTELLQRIIKDERRHYAFYRDQARARMRDNRRAQALVRWALDRFWAPVGQGVRPLEETDHVISCLFGDDDGAETTRAMEEELSKLPGLAGMRIMTRARAAALRRVGHTSTSPLQLVAMA
jgi:rubrerythrin